MIADKAYKTASLTKGDATFLFVWTEDNDYMTVVKYLRGKRTLFQYRVKALARSQWDRLVAVGYFRGPDRAVTAEGVSSIPRVLT
ncbi:unnamed protein product [marine sediment metagenome]|uniref:Uncharacterized protein n=1 Tax=marine sediment metagenome TaxID=412755 RepID=X0W7Y8_9ZZZZ